MQLKKDSKPTGNLRDGFHFPPIGELSFKHKIYSSYTTKVNNVEVTTLATHPAQNYCALMPVLLALNVSPRLVQ